MRLAVVLMTSCIFASVSQSTHHCPPLADLASRFRQQLQRRLCFHQLRRRKLDHPRLTLKILTTSQALAIIPFARRRAGQRW
jgi:hypothetical protein